MAGSTHVHSSPQVTDPWAGPAGDASMPFQGGLVQLANPGTVVVGKNMTVTDFVVSSGITLELVRGGRAKDTTVQSGGIEHVDASSAESGGTVQSGGTLGIFNHGVAKNIIVQRGGFVEVAYGYVEGATVQSGGVLAVLQDQFGGAASGVTVQAGGILLTSGVLITDQAGRLISANTGPVSGGTLSGDLVTVFGPGASVAGLRAIGGTAVTVDSGATVSNLVVGDAQTSGSLYVYSGGQADGVTIRNGRASMEQSTASGILVGSGGLLELDA